MFSALLASLLLSVDCDRGGNLARVLRSLQDVPPQPVVLEIQGTCTGPIEIVREGMTLRGDDPGGAAIVGGVTVRGAHDVHLEHLRLLDSRVALRAIGSEVTVEDCELRRADVVVEAEDATLTLARTTLDGARNGISARRSRVSLEASAIRNVSDEGILARELSDIGLFQSQVSSDAMLVERHSSLSAVHCALQGGIYVDAFSRVSLAGATGPTAALQGDIRASNSEVDLFRLPVQGTVRVGDASFLSAVEADLVEVRLDGGSHARLTGTRVAGNVFAEDFSTVRISSTPVTGMVACSGGGDAVCEQSHAGSVSACPHCVPAPVTSGSP